jgi:hypothetical protein
MMCKKVHSRKLSEVSENLRTNKNKYNFKIGALDSNPFRSNLYSQDNGSTTSVSISENNFDYTKKSIYQKRRI